MIEVFIFFLFVYVLRKTDNISEGKCSVRIILSFNKKISKIKIFSCTNVFYSVTAEFHHL